MASVGTHIKRLRTARGLTQEELAETLFVTRQAVSAWETGKAQPDVETLERIAAALGAAVTEVIYGAPPPDLGRVKRRWALIGGGIVTIIAILLLILVKSGAWGTWREGLAYQFFSPSYSLSYEKIPGSYTLELDLKDLDSNTGKVLYEDPAGCRILVDGMDQARPGEYRGPLPVPRRVWAARAACWSPAASQSRWISSPGPLIPPPPCPSPWTAGTIPARWPG